MKPSGTSLKHLLKNPRRKTSSGVLFSGSSLFFPFRLESFPTSGRKYSVHKRVSASVPDNGLRSCRGSLPTDDGPIAYAWSREKGEVRERLELPKGWTRAEPAAKEGAHGR